MSRLSRRCRIRICFGVIVGCRTAERLLQDSGGSLSKLLNEPTPGYSAQPKGQDQASSGEGNRAALAG